MHERNRDDGLESAYTPSKNWLRSEFNDEHVARREQHVELKVCNLKSCPLVGGPCGEAPGVRSIVCFAVWF